MILPGPLAEQRLPLLCASVTLPSSKSLTNRALIAAAVAGGGRIERALECEDTSLLIDALVAAGWDISRADEVVVGQRRLPGPGGDAAAGTVEVDLGNSGTGARFLLSLLAAVPGRFVVTGTARLQERPMGPLIEALAGLGAGVEACGPAPGCLPVRIEGGQLAGGSVELRPETSSQFISSLLLAAPLMRNGLRLTLAGSVPSRPYLDLTEDVLVRFGAAVERDDEGRHWCVAPGRLQPTRMVIEGDWSAAAFLAGAVAVAGGTVSLEPLELSSRQGDRAVCSILQAAGARVCQRRPGVVEIGGPAVRPLEADLRDTPDLFPVLAAVAASLPPGSRLSGLQNLRYKESDRLGVMVEGLSRLGAALDVHGDTVVVTRQMPHGQATRAKVAAAGDHRIAMAMAVAALRAGPVELDDPACVVKSFPQFWRAWERALQ
jgi:3-phosphoshikimate 1-carboxyvinyltransferase